MLVERIAVAMSILSLVAGIKHLPLRTFNKQSQVKHLTILLFVSFQLVFIFVYLFLSSF